MRRLWAYLLVAEYNGLHMLAASGMAGVACFLIARAT